MRAPAIGQALVAARDADDGMRSALALDRIGRIYLRAGQLEDARQVFSLGVMAADRARSAEAAGWLHASQARVHAAMGDAARARDSIEQSRSALDAPSEAIPAPNNFTLDSWTSIAGKVNFALAETDGTYAASAIDSLSAYTATVDPVRVKRKAFALTELATCHLRSGDPATGIHCGHQAADLAAGISSDGLRQHLRMLARAAQYHPRNTDATDLVHRITAGTAV
ncbi:hypothetical protein [Actinokineospora sp. NBRC 105648]|uniref:hypothetical protein n=1 Tax=Actinokineospora sp. NBRC 105648 TaxID=3032206 RepID=UPI0024A47AF4|nr:hypothetical protein [Actinokineospora sp. NBRC 105648]GLZ39366.1 hypothetical protein Acsp05_29900 [Actinokineospora sp. NBRC 105648]